MSNMPGNRVKISIRIGFMCHSGQKARADRYYFTINI
jgi:hypothetical protein